jgi:prephenate dehydrogenase
MKIGIIGLGLIGGSIAKALRKSHEISAFDINKEALTFAIENNILDKAYFDLGAFLNNNNLIYLCLYPESIVSFFKENSRLIKKDTIFIEISGIKTKLIQDIRKLNLNYIDIVYTHPIAGREVSGVFFADEKIFFNGNYAIINDQNTKTENLELAYSLAKEMGFKNISKINAKLHDQIIAYTSQLTHIISLSLVNSFSNSVDLSHFTGDSYRDLTRIANININLWADLFTNNKNALIDIIANFENELSKFKNALATNNLEELETLMEKAKNKHNKYLEGNKNES